MIVRISGEDQYRLPDDALARVNELDNAVVAAVDAGDEAGFAAAFAELLGFVRASGQELPDEELHGSDVIIPPADTTMAEAAADFTGEGLIPD
ncbi:MAG: hypothetical protein MUC84_06430 [Solirubrobacteraceae bacterium]|jgi:hypothetical protein|nr:hypothetical protein [Solirubrobacteraceae bacterium]MCU0313683.1 hypothetical protein [Solirubrobacteraceae bacterium]